MRTGGVRKSIHGSVDRIPHSSVLIPHSCDLPPKHPAEDVRRHAREIVGDPGAILARATAEDLPEDAAESGSAALDFLPLRLKLVPDLARAQAALLLPAAEVRHNERRQHHEEPSDLLAVEPGGAPDPLLHRLALSAEYVLEDPGSVERARNGDVGGAGGRGAEERGDVIQKAAVVVFLEGAAERLRAVRRLRLVGEAADEHGERHRYCLRSALLVGAELPAHLRERVALELRGDVVEESHGENLTAKVRVDARAGP